MSGFRTRRVYSWMPGGIGSGFGAMRTYGLGPAAAQGGPGSSPEWFDQLQQMIEASNRGASSQSSTISGLAQQIKDLQTKLQAAQAPGQAAGFSNGNIQLSGFQAVRAGKDANGNPIWVLPNGQSVPGNFLPITTGTGTPVFVNTQTGQMINLNGQQITTGAATGLGAGAPPPASGGGAPPQPPPAAPPTPSPAAPTPTPAPKTQVGTTGSTPITNPTPTPTATAAPVLTQPFTGGTTELTPNFFPPPPVTQSPADFGLGAGGLAPLGASSPADYPNMNPGVVSGSAVPATAPQSPADFGLGAGGLGPLPATAPTDYSNLNPGVVNGTNPTIYSPADFGLAAGPAAPMHSADPYATTGYNPADFGLGSGGVTASPTDPSITDPYFLPPTSQTGSVPLY